MILCDESGVLAPTLASTGSKKNSRWRKVRRRTLPAATTPSPYASKLPRPNPPRGEQNCAEPSPRRRNPRPSHALKRNPKKIQRPKPKENRAGGEFGAEPSPRRQNPRQSFLTKQARNQCARCSYSLQARTTSLRRD